MKTKIKTVHGEDIWLEETEDVGLIIPSIALVIAILTAAILAHAMITESDFLMGVAIVGIVSFMVLIVAMITGVLSRTVYSVFSYSRYSSSQTIPILNDGTDRALVCIAAKEIENQIIADYNRVKTLEKIAEGCK